jgi:hypothetical protein
MEEELAETFPGSPRVKLRLNIPRRREKWRTRVPVFSATAIFCAALTFECLLNPLPATAQVRYLNDQIDPAHKNPIRLRDMANRPCVAIKGQVRQETVNTAMVDHYLAAENICPKMIHIKACYVTSNRCVEFDIRSREKKEVLLGMTTGNPSDPFFKFDFTEKERL